MVCGENDEKSMFDWLKILPIYAFEHSGHHHKLFESLARSMRTEENYKENKMRKDNNKIDENNSTLHWFMYVYGTPKKMSAAFPILILYNFNISIV